MTQLQNHSRETPQGKKSPSGLVHLKNATLYSAAGFQRLLQETAARHEIALGAIGLSLLFFTGSSIGHFFGFLILLCALLAAEALNTAIEVVVDHLSPEWSEMAKDAKDLGSLAVGLLLVANLLFLCGAIFGVI